MLKSINIRTRFNPNILDYTIAVTVKYDKLKVMTNNFCKNCGVALEKQAKFCVECGTGINGNTQNQISKDEVIIDQNNKATKTAKTNTNSIAVATLVIIGIVIGSLFGILIYTDNSSENNKSSNTQIDTVTFINDYKIRCVNSMTSGGEINTDVASKMCGCFAEKGVANYGVSKMMQIDKELSANPNNKIPEVEELYTICRAQL